MTKVQSGRSMVEMLGVLAIIGVLSIGGIAGYTMAMNRHKANQAVDYATRLAIAAQTYGGYGLANEANINASDLGLGTAPISEIDAANANVQRQANGVYKVNLGITDNSINNAIETISGGQVSSGSIEFTETGIKPKAGQQQQPAANP